MPRRNRPQRIYRTIPTPDKEVVKKSFGTRREAEIAAAHSMLIDPELKLFVYLSPHDGKWHLTRKLNT